MVFCNKCGAEVTGDICFNCGEKVQINDNSNVCPKCGTKNLNNSTFCSECGHHFVVNLPKTKNLTDWERRRDEVLERYDKLAEEFGIKDEDYFLTSVRRFNLLERGNSLFFGNETAIDGFFIIKEDKFILMEIDNRNWKKVNAGVNNFYFDKIVSMRVTKTLGQNGRYEDITKRTWVNSLHALKRAIRTDINRLKSIRFKDMIAYNDSGDMFDRLLIKLVDNTSYEIRLPSFEFGNNLVGLYEMLSNRPQTVVIKDQDSKSNIAELIKQYNDLFKEGVITKEEFKQFKQKLLE